MFRVQEFYDSGTDAAAGAAAGAAATAAASAAAFVFTTVFTVGATVFRRTSLWRNLFSQNVFSDGCPSNKT